MITLFIVILLISWFVCVLNFFMDYSIYYDNGIAFHLIKSIKVFFAVLLMCSIICLPIIILMKIGFLTCGGDSCL